MKRNKIRILRKIKRFLSEIIDQSWATRKGAPAFERKGFEFISVLLKTPFYYVLFLIKGMILLCYVFIECWNLLRKNP